MTQKSKLLKPNADAPEQKIDRDALLALELFRNPSDVRQAGINAGFSPKYVSCGGYYKKLKTPAFRKLMIETAIAHDLSSLPIAYNINRNALNAASEIQSTSSDNNEKIAAADKVKNIIKETKQTVGLLKQTDESYGKPALTQLISVGQIVMQQLNQGVDRVKTMVDDIVDEAK